MYCPECRSEYRAGYQECAHCHVPLVEVLPEPAPDAADELAALAEQGGAAYVARAPYDEACRMEEALSTRGVAALVVGDPASLVHGAHRFYLLAVRPVDVEQARKCLRAEFEQLIAREGLGGPHAEVVDHDAGAPVTCPACGATFPPADECPDCGLFLGAPPEE